MVVIEDHRRGPKLKTHGVGDRIQVEVPSISDLNPNPLSSKPAIFLNCLAIGCGAWFAIYGMVWVYFSALIIAYPVGLVGWLLHLWAKHIDGVTRLNLFARRLHKVGFALSFTMFISAVLPMIGSLLRH